MTQLNKDTDEHGKGWKIGYDDGYSKGLWASCQKDDECGRCLNVAKPYWKLLPGYGITDLVKIGLEKKKNMIVNLQDAQNIEDEIRIRTANRQGLSLVKISDEEVKVIVEGAGLTLPATGLNNVTLSPPINILNNQPPEYLAPLLARSIASADIVGIPGVSVPNYLPILTEALGLLGINLQTKKLTASTIAYKFTASGYMARLLLNGRPGVVVISPRAKDFYNVLKDEGINVIDSIVVPDGTSFTEDLVRNITAQIRQLSPQIILISLPVIGVILSVRLGIEFPVISWDIGHLSPAILAGMKDLV